ncbi:AfsR/SARP family transcriptional regulator [Actinoplanes utahensis]|uniref:AfsR/SARP family transcriptional regulator n=1 Tax=Actinoplanes utahensis TaxID=1869 RepID=UPI0013789761|nr:BTAD domain-containing putative transcriptional regulator [Actinoplanes utahensis]GIF35051.1 SARP family transcriptional regulator [Actinoplanes utahensis]
MRFRLLGPVEAVEGDRVVALGALKQRHLLAALLFDGGHPVTFETLIDRLWGDEPPADARGALYGYIARLRRVVKDSAGVTLVRWSGGYTLQVPHGSVDLYRFRELLELARDRSGGDRLAVLDEALALWRGEALAGLPGEWARRTRQSLEQQRVTALADWAAVAVVGGRHAEATDRLAAALTRDPLSEPLIAALMRALHASGRTVEALDLFARSRNRIIDELGAEPGPLVRAAHTSVLREPATESAPPRPDRPFLLPPDLQDYTGFDRQVTGTVAALRSGGSPVVVVSGQGGAGKTAFAVHVAHAVRDHYPDGLLFLNVGGADPLEPAEALSRLLRMLGVVDADVQGRCDLREREARYRAELAGRRVLVVVDDVVSARQVHPFRPGDAGSALLVTSRNRLATVPASSRVELPMMSVAEASALLTRVIGPDRAEAEPGQTARLIALCARLPLAVRVAGARLAARPHWAVAQLADRLDDERRRLDELAIDDLEVRAGLAVGYRGLSPRAQAAFRALGCLDPPMLTAVTVAALLDTTLDEADDLVEEITDARLLDVVGADGPFTLYRMHDLVRLYAGELARADPQALRATVTGAVTTLLRLVEHLAQQLPVATPRLYHPAGLPEPGPHWTDTIARMDLRSWFDDEEPALIAAVERAAALDLVAPACGLADALVFASFAARNNFDGWERTHSAACAAAGRAADTLAEAAMECGTGQLRYAQDRFPESRQHFSRAATLFEAAGHDRGLAVAVNGLGTVSRELGEHATAVPLLSRAREMLERLGDDAGVAHAHYGLGYAYREAGDDEVALKHFASALELYRKLGHRRGELISIRGVGLVHRARGELAEAEAHCAAAHEIAGAIGERHLAAYTAQALAKVWIRQGDPERGREPLRTALVVTSARRDGLGAALVTRTLGELELAAGRPGEAIGLLDSAAAQWRAIGMDLGLARTLRDLGAARCRTGDHEGAHRDWATAAEIFHELGVRENAELTAWRAGFGCACDAATVSASCSARSTSPPASAAGSESGQPRAAGSPNSRG